MRARTWLIVGLVVSGCSATCYVSYVNLLKGWEGPRTASEQRYDGPNNGMCAVLDRVDTAHSVTMRLRLVADKGETVVLDWGKAFVEDVSWPSAGCLRIRGILAWEEVVPAQVPGLEIQYDLRKVNLKR